MIILYTTPSCKKCAEAKEWLKARDYPFEVKDVSVDKEAKKRMVDHTEQMSVPVIEFEYLDKPWFIVGFESETWEAYLSED
jgi:arsenate reductase-like glutaredoxin family protein